MCQAVCVHYLCVLLQVSDVEKILGIVHTENLHITAEAYDIALDITPGKLQKESINFYFDRILLHWHQHIEYSRSLVYGVLDPWHFIGYVAISYKFIKKVLFHHSDLQHLCH